MKVSLKPNGAFVVRAFLMILHTGLSHLSLSLSVSRPGCDGAELKVLSSLFQTRPLIASFRLWSLGSMGQTKDSHRPFHATRWCFLLLYTSTNT